MRKFKIGERARIRKDAVRWGGSNEMRGKSCTIASYVDLPCICGCGAPVYDVHVENILGRVDEGVLQKMLPESDTYSTGSWDDFHKIIHKPTEVIS